MLTLEKLKEGDRVLLKGDHPWATYAGTVIGWELVDLFGVELPKVRLDIGPECFIFNTAQVRRTERGTL